MKTLKFEITEEYINTQRNAFGEKTGILEGTEVQFIQQGEKVKGRVLEYSMSGGEVQGIVVQTDKLSPRKLSARPPRKGVHAYKEVLILHSLFGVHKLTILNNN